HESTSFVGRRREIIETKRLLSSARLMTLTGTGGVGKTRLALRVAGDVARAFVDGVWLVDISELRDADALATTISDAIGLHSPSDRSDVRLTEYLAERTSLLVLDCCERLIVPISVLCTHLLRRCPNLRIIATSRQALGIAGEAVFAVPPLTTPNSDRSPVLQGLSHYDAVSLFADRAATVVPEFGLTESNHLAVAQICSRLEGIPLAIESAAIRMRVMSADQILQKLSDRYCLLTVGPRSAPSRHQSLRSCTEWSFGLCSTSEQALWSRLSVFEGSFDLDAAESICAGYLAKEEVLDVLASLIDKSILIRETDGAAVRYRLLDTLRDYVKERMHPGLWASLRRRHRDCFLQLATRARREWGGPRQVEWDDKVWSEYLNISAALQFCTGNDDRNGAAAGLQLVTSLYPFWCARGMLTDARRWLRRVLDRAEPSAAGRIEALCAATTAAALQGDMQAGLEFAEELLVLGAGNDNPCVRPYISYVAGCRSLLHGRVQSAQSCFEDADMSFREQGDLFWNVWSVFGVAVSRGFAGDIERVHSCLFENAACATTADTSSTMGWISWIAGFANFQRGDLTRAEHTVKEGLRFTQTMNDQFGASGCLELSSWIAAQRQQARRAAVLMGAAGKAASTAAQLLPQHAHFEQQVRRALGEHEFITALSRGRNATFEEAVAYALGEATPSSSSSQCPYETALTRRERQVAELISRGMTNREIASKLVIAQRTAQGHVEHILHKLGFTSRCQIAAWVVERQKPPALA
ncbi:MAG: LuxR family transcriptional regulator, partial [Alcaligenaceae bacterium]